MPPPASGAAAQGEAPAGRIWRHDPELWTRYLRAVFAYVPRPQNIPLRFLMASDEERGRPDPTRGWGRVAPHGVLQPIAGNHRTCITQELGSLASALNAALAALTR